MSERDTVGRPWRVTGIAVLLVGVAGLWRWPFPHDWLLSVAIRAHAPGLYRTLAISYALLWFSTPALALLLAQGLRSTGDGLVAQDHIARCPHTHLQRSASNSASCSVNTTTTRRPSEHRIPTGS
jgi:hypothetical protein